MWWGKGIRSVVYIDDGIIVAPGPQKAWQDSNIVKSSLEAAGFVINVDKSHWDPTKKGKWLGFEIDLGLGYIAVPKEKIEGLKQYLLQARDANTLPARTLAKIIG